MNSPAETSNNRRNTSSPCFLCTQHCYASVIIIVSQTVSSATDLQQFQSCAARVHFSPPNVLVSSLHRVNCLPLLLVPPLSSTSVTLVVHRLSLLRTTCITCSTTSWPLSHRGGFLTIPRSLPLIFPSTSTSCTIPGLALKMKSISFFV